MEVLFFLWKSFICFRFKIELLRVQPCWFSVYQQRAEKRWAHDANIPAAHTGLVLRCHRCRPPDSKWHHSGQWNIGFEQIRPYVNKQIAVTVFLILHLLVRPVMLLCLWPPLNIKLLGSPLKYQVTGVPFKYSAVGVPFKYQAFGVPFKYQATGIPLKY